MSAKKTSMDEFMQLEPSKLEICLGVAAAMEDEERFILINELLSNYCIDCGAPLEEDEGHDDKDEETKVI